MKKVILVAPVLSRSGYGEMGRFALRALLSNPNVDLYLHNINWGKTGWIWKDDDERRIIDSLLQKTVIYRQNGGQFDASVQCTIPNEWQKLTPHDIGYTAGIETDKVAPVWLTKGNEVDKIITISNHSMNVYKNTAYDGTNTQTGEPIKGYKCTTPMDCVGFPKKNIEAKEMEIDLKHDFNFLCVAQIGPRKNVDAVINNFIEEFKNEEVGLVLKLNRMNDSIIDFHAIQQIFKQISATAKKEEWTCSINVIHGNLTDEQMQGLYQHPKIKAAVSFTHGEGFGLPMYEASYNGLPVVATDWSGHLDFLTLNEKVDTSKFRGGSTRGKISTNKKMFANVKYELKQIPAQAVWDGVLQADSKWAFVDDQDARKKMRDVYKNYGSWKKKAEKLAASYDDEQALYDKFNEALDLPEEPKEESFMI